MKVATIKIIKCTGDAKAWYVDKIGQKFIAVQGLDEDDPYFKNYWRAVPNSSEGIGYMIDPNDIKIVKKHHVF